MNTHLRAALLMLASTVAFGLMAICIRLASATEPTWEVAFFRNFFGLLSLLPMLLWPVLRQPQPVRRFHRARAAHRRRPLVNPPRA